VRARPTHRRERPRLLARRRVELRLDRAAREILLEMLGPEPHEPPSDADAADLAACTDAVEGGDGDTEPPSRLVTLEK